MSLFFQRSFTAGIHTIAGDYEMSRLTDIVPGSALGAAFGVMFGTAFYVPISMIALGLGFPMPIQMQSTTSYLFTTWLVWSALLGLVLWPLRHNGFAIFIFCFLWILPVPSIIHSWIGGF